MCCHLKLTSDSARRLGLSLKCCLVRKCIKETPAVTDFRKAKGPKDWEYFTFPKNVRAHLIPDENGNAELVVVVSGAYALSRKVH